MILQIRRIKLRVKVRVRKDGYAVGLISILDRGQFVLPVCSMYMVVARETDCLWLLVDLCIDFGRHVRLEPARAAVRLGSPNRGRVSQGVRGAIDGGVRARSPGDRAPREERVLHHAAADVGPQRQRPGALVPPAVTAAQPDRAPRPGRQASHARLQREERRG